MSADAFAVDVDELDALVGDLERCEQSLEQLGADVEREVAALHAVWAGLAAEAQRAAQEEWERGRAAMHHALGELRAAARTAHVNYTAATETNVALWRRLR